MDLDVLFLTLSAPVAKLGNFTMSFLMNISLIQRPTKVELDPFPHMVIPNALPEHIYLELLRTRPSYEWIVNGREEGSNKRLDVAAKECLERGVPAIWEEFIKYHVSNDFWLEVKEIFGDYIRLMYPNLYMSGLMDTEPGIRRATKKPFFLDCNIGLNTPCLEKSSVRGPHIDNPVELFAGLFYMGTGGGGNLVINRLIKPPHFYGKMEIKEDCVEYVKEVPYKHNMFIVLLNSPLSVHSVTLRDSLEPRNLINVIGEYQFQLFTFNAR
jgi:hypothetical protein